MSKKSPVDSDNYYAYPAWFEGGNQSQPSTSSYSYPTLEYIWSNAVRLTRTTHSNLQDEIEYIEANLGGGGNESCNCSALQFGIDSNTTKIENLSTIKLSRDGSQSMTGLLKCESGLETNTIAPYSGDTIECTDNLKLDGDIVGDSTDGLNLIAEDTTVASRIQLTPGSNSKILLGTFSGQSVVPRIEISEGSGNVSITIRGAHLIPYTDNDQDLGTFDKKWKNIYANRGYFSHIDNFNESQIYIDRDIEVDKSLWGANNLLLAGGNISNSHPQITLYDKSDVVYSGSITFRTPDSSNTLKDRLFIWGGYDDSWITVYNARLVPGTNNELLLGSSTNRWKEIYAVKGNFSGIIIPDNIINIGPYSAIVYKDDTGVYAKDASGNIIAQGTADVDDASVIQSAIDALDYGEKLLLKAATYILDRKLILKPINFVGEGIGYGHGTILELADNVNDDIIEMYSGGTLSHRYYYVNGRLAHLKIRGNKDAQTAGNGIVLAWTQHFIIEDVEIRDVHDYAIKILRSYWTTVRNAHVTQCGNGIKIGEYDSNGKYNDGDPADLYSNSNLLQTVHVDHCDIGIHIECGTLNQMNMCDTSACTTGILLQPVSGVEKVWKTIIIGHWFESVTTPIKAVAGGTAGCRYATIVNPIYTNTGSNDLSGDQHVVKIDAQTNAPIILQRYKRIETGNIYIQEYLDLTRGNSYLRSRWGNTAIQASNNGGSSYTTVAKITTSGLDIEKCIIRNLKTAEGVFPIVYGTQSIAAGSTVYAAKFDVPSGKTLKIHTIAELYDPDNQISAKVYDVTDSTEIASVDGFDDTGWSVPSGHNVEFQLINADSSNAHMGNYGFLVSYIS